MTWTKFSATKRLTLLLIPMAFVALAVAFYFDLRVDRAVDGTAMVSASDSNSPQIGELPVAKSEPVSRVGGPTTESNEIHPNSASPLDKYFESQSLLHLVEEYDLSSGHDPDAAMAIAMALDECYTLRVAGDKSITVLYESMVKQFPTSKERLLAIEQKLSGRCKGLSQLRGDLLRSEVIDSYLKKAAERGSSIAQAKLLRGRLESDDPDALRRDLLQLLRTGDAEVVLALDGFLSSSSKLFDDGTLLHAVGESQWVGTLAACRLGLDCSANGFLMYSMCIAGFPCVFQNVEEIIRFGMSPYEFERARALSEQLVHEVRFGAVGAAPDPLGG